MTSPSEFQDSQKIVADKLIDFLYVGDAGCESRKPLNPAPLTPRSSHSQAAGCAARAAA